MLRMKRYESIKGVAEFLRKVEEDDFDPTVAASAAHVARIFLDETARTEKRGWSDFRREAERDC